MSSLHTELKLGYKRASDRKPNEFANERQAAFFAPTGRTTQDAGTLHVIRNGMLTVKKSVRRQLLAALKEGSFAPTREERSAQAFAGLTCG